VKPCLRGFAETSYRQNPGTGTDARIEATTKGLDIRFVVTRLSQPTCHAMRGTEDSDCAFHG
jgi:hypothetical protein